jgi:UDP-3-O-[3-hydroxymyristoyl] N-acetylglucosamine deacetylase
VRKISDRAERTIARPAGVQGTGYLTGRTVHLRFVPAPVRTGVVFVRTDLEKPAHLRAHISQVTGAQRRTTLGQSPLTVSLVEHVLAALSGMRVDNCYVELDAPEPPGLDGSAQPFVEALCSAGIVIQPARKAIWAVTAKLTVQQPGATLSLHPAEEPGLRASYILDYGDRSSIVRQMHTAELTPQIFKQDIAPCRTFVTQEEALELQRQGIGKRTKPSDLVIFGPRGPIDNQLRFADEPARHKILDLVGDLSLLGEGLCGHVTAYRSGHSLNIELVRELQRRLEHSRADQSAAA